VVSTGTLTFDAARREEMAEAVRDTVGVARTDAQAVAGVVAGMAERWATAASPTAGDAAGRRGQIMEAITDTIGLARTDAHAVAGILSSMVERWLPTEADQP
jgi:hypothetical protein